MITQLRLQWGGEEGFPIVQESECEVNNGRGVSMLLMLWMREILEVRNYWELTKKEGL